MHTAYWVRTLWSDDISAIKTGGHIQRESAQTTNVSTELKTWSSVVSNLRPPPQGGNQLLLTEQAVSPALVKLVSRSAGETKALVY